MRKYLFVFLFLLAIVSPCLASPQLDEANAKFTYQGKPIHPFLLKEFSNWESDCRPPMTVTVDVAAAFESNKYYQDDVKKTEDWWFAQKSADDIHYESFEYKWLGKMANGIHVLEVGDSGGGSGTFMDLMFIKFSEGEYPWDNKKAKQLLMTIVGTHGLGDRYEGEIKVFPEKVFIPASTNQQGGGSPEKDVELKFPIKQER